MKNFLKRLFLLIIILMILILFLIAVVYAIDCARGIGTLNEYISKIEVDKRELINNENNLEVNQKQQKIVKEAPPIVVEKPQKGVQFGILKIPSIDVELAMMNGTAKNLLSQGVGIDDESYFPGEGGSIVLMGHNFKQFLARLPEVNNGDDVIIETNYGQFHYSVYDSKIINEYNVREIPIQNNEEIVMIYTCWPIPNVSHANERYVIYAK